MKNVNTRQITLRMLISVYKDNLKSNIVLNENLNHYADLDKRDRAFISRLFKGVIENQIQLDYIISQFSKTKLSKINLTILLILRMGIYQLLFMDNIPNRAVVNESVKLVHKFKLSNLSGFVNAILRQVSNNVDTLMIPNNNLGIKYSVPEDIINLLINEYGEEITTKILNYFQNEQRLNIRINTSLISVTDYKKMLLDNSIVFEDNKYFKYALDILKYDKVSLLPGYNEGFFCVQDTSSMLVGEIISHLKPNKILDLCASPGGKTMHIADLNPESSVLSLDISKFKVDSIIENIHRINFKNIEVGINDATILNNELIEKFDVVLVDAPCSGLGVIGTKSDIKNNFDINNINNLLEIQTSILNNAIKYTKPNGYIVYSTCTLNIAENLNNIINFININPNLKMIDISSSLPKLLLDEFNNIKEDYLINNNIKLTKDNFFVQMIPGINNMNGAFVAVVQK